MGDIELIWTDPNNAGPNGTSIAGAKVPDVLVGQYINPTVDVIAPADVLYILWDAPPGRTFDRWDESADFKTANLVPGPSSLLLGTDSPHWVWADPGDNRAITVNVETSGGAYSLTTHVNVKAPTVSSGTSIGEAEFVPTRQNGVWHFFIAGSRFDFMYAAAVSQAPGFAQGDWKFLQLASNDWRQTVNGRQVKCTFGGVVAGLDNGNPYGGGAGRQTVQPRPLLKTGEAGEAHDAPHFPLLPRSTGVSVNSVFETYIMFKPPGSNSQWVPLQVALWECHSRTIGANLVDDNRVNGTPEFPSAPRWDALIENGRAQWI